MLTNIQVKQVQFDSDELLGIQYENQIYTAIRKACECLGFSEGQTNRQMSNAQSDLVVSKGVSNLVLPTKSCQQATLCLMIDFLPLLKNLQKTFEKVLTL